METPFSVHFSGEPPCYAPGGHGFVTGTELRKYPALLVPEVNSGFEPVWWYKNQNFDCVVIGRSGASAHPAAGIREKDLEGRTLPLWYKADVDPGQYRITASLSAAEDCGEALLFVGRRRLCWRGAIKAGERVTVTALCSVSPIIPSGGGDAAVSDLGRMEDTSIDVAVMGAALAEISITPWDGPSLWLMGDSTVTDQPAQIPYAPGVTYAGWGQMLPLYLGVQYCVSNHAHSGLSTETFRDRGHYGLLRGLIRPGDVVLIQFGHNDQKRKHLAADAGYTDNLKRYIRELRSLGAVPVLVTSLARNTWTSGTQYNDMLAPFAGAVKKIGQVMEVPVLDLHARMMEAIQRVGMDAARVWFHPCDYTHTNDFGAHMAAGFVAEELASAGLAVRRDVPAWPVHAPLDMPEPPEGLAPPEGTAPLVDYGLVPDAPWPVT